MKYFAFTYSYDSADPRIAQTRPQHREFISNLKQQGKILGSGPFVDSAGGALIVIQLTDESDISAATELMNADPFWLEQLLSSRSIQEWNPVINSFEA